MERTGSRLEEGLQTDVVAESATGQQRRDGAAEAGERGRLRHGVREQPFQARSDHPAMVVPGTYPPLTVPLSAQREALRAGRVAPARDLRLASHSFQATRIWAALKIEE